MIYLYFVGVISYKPTHTWSGTAIRLSLFWTYPGLSVLLVWWRNYKSSLLVKDLLLAPKHHPSLPNWLFWNELYGHGSKPMVPKCEHQDRWDLWMWITQIWYHRFWPMAISWKIQMHPKFSLSSPSPSCFNNHQLISPSCHFEPHNHRIHRCSCTEKWISSRCPKIPTDGA